MQSDVFKKFLTVFSVAAALASMLGLVMDRMAVFFVCLTFLVVSASWLLFVHSGFTVMRLSPGYRATLDRLNSVLKDVSRDADVFVYAGYNKISEFEEHEYFVSVCQ